MLRSTGVPDVRKVVPDPTTTDLVHRALAPGAAGARARRAPHHDDSFTVAMPVGVFNAVRGGQDVIDQGLVSFTGEPCAHLHLAAHRSTHGSPFARIPELHAGDRLEVWSPSVACAYEIIRVEAVTSNIEPPFGDLMVQTSLPGGFFLAFGQLV
jgi:hypothetical protein